MFRRKISKIVKRDGRIADFDRSKIISAISKSAISSHENPLIGNRLVDNVEKFLFKGYRGRLPTVENVQDAVEKVLIKLGYENVAKTYILYRQKREEIRNAKRFYGVKSDQLKLSVNAIQVLQRRYLLRDDDGKIIETPLDLFRRVSKAIADVDKKYGENHAKSEDEFFDVMTKLEFLPNTPCLMNAGTKFQMMSACFVLPVEDSLDKIFDTLKTAGLLQKFAAGTGFSFSRLRQKGAIISGTKGVSSGSISFMSLFDSMTDVIKQGSKRRGANMGVLGVNHPDILEFISCKNDVNAFANFNISVAANDDFMNKVLKNEKYNLIDPRTNKVLKRLNARGVFDMIVSNAWHTGDPGLIFIDRINKMHSLHDKIEATNPCGEQPLLAYESCVLGSINLAKFVNNKKIDWERLGRVVEIGVHFLDNVIDANDYVIKEIEEMTKLNRKIGLGVMGWADMLIQLGISYDSNDALKLAEKVMHFISSRGRLASQKIGKKRGDFPNFRNSKLVKHFKHQRNATVTTIAPTGTISILADASSGIEPIFAMSFVRDVMDGTRLLETNKHFEGAAKEFGFYNEDLVHEISKTGSIQQLKHISQSVKKVFVTAFDIKPEWHVKMQAAFQKYVDNGVSKTINLPESATKDDVKKIYLMAYKLGCKGITVFRYGSKHGKQVLYLEEGYERRIKQHSEFAGGCPIVECGE